MKRMLKKIMVGAVATLSLFAFAACGNNNDTDYTPVTDDNYNVEDTTTDPVEVTSERTTLRMATSADFPPFEFIGANGEYDGFDIHMAHALAEILGYELLITNMNFDGVIASVVTGASDIAVAALSITEERLLSVAFTDPYFETSLVAIVQYDSDIVELEQLEYATIAVQLGTTSDIMLDWFLPYADVRQFRNAPDTVLALTSGQADAIVIDRSVADQFINDVDGLRILEQVLAVEEYAIAVNINDTELVARLNDALAELVASGEMQRIYDMFFGGE